MQLLERVAKMILEKDFTQPAVVMRIPHLSRDSSSSELLGEASQVLQFYSGNFRSQGSMALFSAYEVTLRRRHVKRLTRHLDRAVDALKILAPASASEALYYSCPSEPKL